MISLNLRTDLPKIRAAFDAKQLQAQHSSVSNFNPRYAGPCAIGVLIPQHLAVFWDLTSRDVASLFDSGDLAAAEDQQADWSRLQSAHDKWLILGCDNEKHRDIFAELLAELETKYA